MIFWYNIVERKPMNHYLYTYIIIGLGFALGYLVRLIEDDVKFEIVDVIPMVLSTTLYPIMVFSACIAALQPDSEEEETEDANNTP